MKYFSQCDVLIFDLHSGDPYDYKLALKAFEKAKELDEEKVLIIISSLMVWNNTPPKLKEKGTKDPVVKGEGEGEEGEDDEKKEEEEPVEADEEKEEPAAEDAEKGSQEGDKEKRPEIEFSEEEEIEDLPKDMVQIAFTENDYKMRQPTSEYELIKQIEDEILEFKKENLKVYVIASGVLYGNGENIFNQHLKQAWL